MIRRLALLPLLILVLTACEIRSHLTIDAADLSNGTVTAEIGFDEDFREAMESFGGDADLIGEIEDSAPGEDWTVSRFTDGDIEGATLSHDFSSLEELQELLTSSMVASDEPGGYEQISFTDEGDTLRFEARLAAPAPEGESLEGFDMEGISEFLDFDMEISVTFPGSVIDHNGELEGNTVVWKLDEEALAGAELFAEGRKAAGFNWSILLWVVLAMIPIGVVLWAINNRRRESPAPVEPQPVSMEPVPPGE